jgi:hypothetical protein
MFWTKLCGLRSETNSIGSAPLSDVRARTRDRHSVATQFYLAWDFVRTDVDQLEHPIGIGAAGRGEQMSNRLPRPRAAARELEIDELAMRGYCTEKAVPRYLMLAIERLVDLRRMKVYHIARAENAVKVLAGGFRDSTGTYLSGSVHKGVWVSDQLSVLLSGIELDDMACFEIKVLEEWLIRHESIQKRRDTGSSWCLRLN